MDRRSSVAVSVLMHAHALSHHLPSIPTRRQILAQCKHLTRTSASATISLSQVAADSTLRSASLVLLLHESLRRAAGRPLLDCPDLLQLPELVQAMRCCLVVAEPAASASPQHSSVAPSSGHEELQASRLVVTYANDAAVQLFTGSSNTGEADSTAAATAGTGPSSSASGGQDSKAAPGPLLGKRLSQLLTSPPEHLLHVPHPSPALPRMELYQRVAMQQQQDGSSTPGKATAFHADVLACDVCSPSGRTLGRALLFDKWSFADGRIGRPLVPAMLPSELPGTEDVQAAEEHVRLRADAVRHLKVQQGLGNQDPLVQAAVRELQAAKSRSAALRELLHAYGSSEEGGVLRAFLDHGPAAA